MENGAVEMADRNEIEEYLLALSSKVNRLLVALDLHVNRI